MDRKKLDFIADNAQNIARAIVEKVTIDAERYLYDSDYIEHGIGDLSDGFKVRDDVYEMTYSDYNTFLNSLEGYLLSPNELLKSDGWATVEQLLRDGSISNLGESLILVKKHETRSVTIDELKEIVVEVREAILADELENVYNEDDLDHHWFSNNLRSEVEKWLDKYYKEENTL